VPGSLPSLGSPILFRLKKIIIRPIEKGDIDQTLPLVHQLGYQITQDELCSCFEFYDNSSESFAYVAEEDGCVIGVISAHLIPYFHRKRKLLRITSLAVDNSHRKKGIGAMLMEKVQLIGMQQNCDKIEATSGNRRENEAHLFYEKMGFDEYDGKRFVKTII
jgi:GNAT superfamily N-acetyltransferase